MMAWQRYGAGISESISMTWAGPYISWIFQRNLEPVYFLLALPRMQDLYSQSGGRITIRIYMAINYFLNFRLFFT